MQIYIIYQILNIIIISTTMELYKQIQLTLNNQEPLNEMIASIYSSLLPKRKFIPNGLTQQQCLSLVYEHLRAPLSKLKERIQNQIKQDNITDQEPQQEVNQEQLNIQNQDGEEQGQQAIDEENQGQNDAQPYDQEEAMENGEQDNDEMNEAMKRQGSQASQDDVGVYGEEIDEQSMQSYENQVMDDDPEFGNFNLNKMEDKFDMNKAEKQDQFVEDNFDQFRQIQLENRQQQKKQEQTELQKQIQRLEGKAMQTQTWILTGQVKAKERPVNSLIQNDLQFKSGIKHTHEITQAYNSSLEAIIKQRILDEIYDDRVRIIPNTSLLKSSKWQKISTQKSNKGLAQLYEIEFKNSLGLGDNKNEKVKKQILDSLKQISYYLDSLSNTGFSLKPNSSLQKNGAQAIILEDKVPVTNWNGNIESSKLKTNFESEKQVNNKTKRLRNKRNARQRKKQQDQKKMNKSIQYGGMTKMQAEARKKISKTKQAATSIKYNKSSSFFSNINNKSKAGKPNPNLNKLKI